MTNQKTEIEELKALQRESQKLRKKREKPDPQEATDAEADKEKSPLTGVSQESDSTVDQDGNTDGLTAQVETIMLELEEAAAEHPGLALLAAFGIGVFVGQLLSRR